ncbi:hypothetical protein F6X40_01890 [Paraburkholderia sp. UCT31]|uniref:hypothetical protein n=1 Tax=Paraburkholderia sp. UCT31 TaxID=2615209 RepID=UPI001655250A|nr:hypothetical protein [Paraburkholderia sp. UCT31]MBC8735616.1 hypothetical protein [Paraburkholderia sp. UCT31]
MSRRDLLDACQRISIRPDHVTGGKRGSKDNNWLRTELINRTYGPGMQWQFRSAAEADQVCVRAVDCRLGKLGRLLSIAQASMREGNRELVEYKRLCGLTRRRPNDEAELLRSARQWFEISRIAQELCAVETGVNNREVH